MSETLVRPMLADDVVRAEEITDLAFHGADVEYGGRSWPAPLRRTESARARWIDRTGDVLSRDPGGCWVAEVDGEVIGVAISVRRDLTWILCSYAVLPGRQAEGVGRPLLEAAGTHSHGCLRAMFAASSDPRAVRRYLLAGFSLTPWMTLSGVVDRSALPTRTHVRTGVTGDRDLMDSVDRRCRDAAHGEDHDILLRHHPLLVVDRPSGQGYAYVGHEGGSVLLAATNRRTAAELLWESLALAPEGESVSVAHVGPGQQWALQVAVQARLSVHTAGYLALRGMKEPSCYLPHGALL